MPIKGAVVLTTIFDPIVLESYFRNFETYGHLQDVRVFLIPDRKTPRSAFERCASLNRRGFPVTSPLIEEQESFLTRIGLPPELIPHDSDNRRNVGFLMALESGADFVMSIDDDNYCQPGEDFFMKHAAVCQSTTKARIIESTTGWFNVCRLLKLDSPATTYARGFPYYARHKEENLLATEGQVAIHMNAGLWLSNPDLDAITWLVSPTQAVEFAGESVVLGTRTWSPVNTQNTALRREVIVGYYFVRMGYRLGGIPIDRYGDIFSGYFAQACMRHLGGALRVGTPVVEHRRNSHSYMKDAFNEWACIMVFEDLLPWLTQEARLSGSTYVEAYESLSHEIEDAVGHFSGPVWTESTRSYFHEVARCMRIWAKTCERLGVGPLDQVGPRNHVTWNSRSL